MDQNEKRVVIKYINLKGLTPYEILNDMNAVLGNDAIVCYNLPMDC